MKKIKSLILLLFCTVLGASGQKVTEIVSFTYHINYDGVLWYIIEPCFKYDNGEILCKKDSILSINPILNNIFLSTYKIDNDWFIGKTCYRYKNIEKCYTDSILLYTPIKYFIDKNEPSKEDTLTVVDYSEILYDIGEPKIFGTKKKNDIFRFMWISENNVDIYYLIKKQSEISLNYKKAIINESIEVINDTTCAVSLTNYNKFLKKLNKGRFWETEYDIFISPRDILIEIFLDGKYYFINKNSKEIEMDNKNLLKIFPLLKSLMGN